MPKFNVKDTRAAAGRGVIATTGPTLTHEGGAGHARDLKSELFMLAVSNMVGEETFYESAAVRDERYARLVREAAVADPVWTDGMLRWLRTEGNMRSASLVGAAEFVHARLGLPKVSFHELAGREVRADKHYRSIDRTLIASVLQRADEPGELLAYWMSRYGRNVPKPVKRGVADAARKLYTEYALLKYDTASHGLRFGDVLDLTHPTPVAPWQGELFKYALDRRHNREGLPSASGYLPMAACQAEWRRNAQATPLPLDGLLDPAHVRTAGLTWEDVLSALGSKVDKAKLWEALIPTMGYMALLRNLRNFDEAGISREAGELVAARLADPEQVAKGRQFPYRYLAAYENATGARWALPLETALNHSLGNIPELPGKTLVLIDTSSSMTNMAFSAKSTMTPVKAAAVFGVALAMRCGADLHGFASGVFAHKLAKVWRAGSLLREVDQFVSQVGRVGHGTQIAESVRATFKGHDRVFIFSDGQTMGSDVTNSAPANVAMYGFNLGGYRAGMMDLTKPNRVELGSLTDATFKLIPLIEKGARCEWPWQATSA